MPSPSFIASLAPCQSLSHLKSSIMSRKCSICGLSGHNQRTCPKKHQVSPIPEEKRELEAKAEDSSTASTTSTALPPKESTNPNAKEVTAACEANSETSPTDLTATAEKIADDLIDDDQLLEAELGLSSLPSTDDGVDEDYQPDATAQDNSLGAESSESSTNAKGAASSKAKKTGRSNKQSAPPRRVQRKNNNFRPPLLPNQSATAPPAPPSSNPPRYFDPSLSPPLIPGTFASNPATYYPRGIYRPPPRNLANGRSFNWRHPSQRYSGTRTNHFRQPFAPISTNVPYYRPGGGRGGRGPPRFRQPGPLTSRPQPSPNHNTQPPPFIYQHNGAQMPPLAEIGTSFSPNPISPDSSKQPEQPPHPRQDPPKAPLPNSAPPPNVDPTPSSTTPVTSPPVATAPSEPLDYNPSPVSNSTYDPDTGVIQPSHEAIIRMSALGLNLAYAVAWSTGGGVFLTKTEAMISKASAEAGNTNPSDPRAFKNRSCSLSENVALAISWIMSRLPQHDHPQHGSRAHQHSSSASSGPAPAAPTAAAPGTPLPQQRTPHNFCTPDQPNRPVSQPLAPSQHNNLNVQQSQYNNNNTPQSATPSSVPTASLVQHPQVSSPQAHNASPSSPASSSLLSVDEWTFSQEDVLVRKQLLSANLRAISIVEKTPDANRLPYIAAPGSAKGIVIANPTPGLQQMMIDPTTGTITLKPRHLPTLRLLDFSAFLSLMFRAIDMASRESSNAGTAAAAAIQTLIRELTRQYESMQWAQEEAEVWMMIAYLRWTHMVQSRTLMIGCNAEQAFILEAKRRNRSSSSQPYSRNFTMKQSPHIIHGSSHKKLTNSPQHASSPTQHSNRSSPQSSTNTSHWFICPCCGVVNDHFSPACPTQASGPKPIPHNIRTATTAAINAAPISQSAKANLSRMTSSLYAKLDRPL